ncbi:MAG: peptidoglycan DD-metalloendopeptidase family protein [Muribaculaceae bacterium]
MKKYLLFLILLFCVSPNVDAQNKSMKNIKRETQTTQKEIKETSQKIKVNTSQTNKSLNKLNLITAEIKEHGKIITTLSTQLDTINQKIGFINDSIQIQEKRLEKLRENYANAVKKMHSQSSSYDKMMFLFSSSSFRQAYRRMRYLQQFSRWREKQSVAIKEAQNVLVEQRNKLQGLQKTKASTLTNVNAVQKSLEVKETQQSQVVTELKKEGGALKALLKEKERKARALNNELDRLIAAEERKAAERARIAQEKRAAEERRIAEQKRIAEETRQRLEEEKRQQQQETTVKDKDEDIKVKPEKPIKEKKKKPIKPAKKKKEEEKKKEVEQEKAQEQPQPIRSGEYNMDSEERNISGSFESNKGQLLFPVKGSYKIVKQFGRQRHPELKYVETDNGGIDIETSSGASACAIFNGKVSAVFRQDGFNTVVMVRHGNYLSIYVNLSEIYVRTGQDIKAGQSIGKIFSDPDDDNRTILHFEIRKEKVKLNPELWVR